MKFEQIQPTQGVFSFTNADVLVDFATANNMDMHGHALVWNYGLPAWLSGGTFTETQLRTVMETHITTVMQRYQGRVATWDMVNEPFLFERRMAYWQVV